jgi:hypothetical protein
VTLAGSPAAAARSAIDRHDRTASAVDMFWLRRLNVSVATTTALTSSTPAAMARSTPRSFSTRPT